MAQDWSPIPSLSDVTTDDPISWLFEALKQDVGADGFFDNLGPNHAAQFTDGSETLLVAFEQTDALLRQSRGFRPLARGVQSRGNIAQLTLLARSNTWFRAPEIYTFFDDLIDDGFFDGFNRVIFYGAGAQGYAAATYSIAAPGAEVVVLQPQATLTPASAGWDDRYTETRRMDFTSRYGYAPSMMETASKGYVIVDPAEREDFMHACLFRRDRVEIIRQRHLGPKAEAQLDAAGLLDNLLDLIVFGEATPARIVNCLRPRRDQYAHLNRVLTLTETSESDWRSGVVARHANARTQHSRFSTALDTATAALAAQGRTLPGVSADESPATPAPSDADTTQPLIETPAADDVKPDETPEAIAPTGEDTVDAPQTEPVVEADFEDDPAQVAALTEVVGQIPDPAPIAETAATVEDAAETTEDLPFADGILTPSGAAPVSNWPSAETPSLREAHSDGAAGAALMSPDLVEPPSPGAISATPADPVKQRLSQSLQTRQIRSARALHRPTKNTRPGKRKR